MYSCPVTWDVQRHDGEYVQTSYGECACVVIQLPNQLLNYHYVVISVPFYVTLLNQNPV